MESELEIVARHSQEAPVDLRNMFDDLGVRFRQIPMGSQSGQIERIGDNFIISVNSQESESRQRFTAAHELAHYLMHRDLMDHGKRMYRHVDQLYGGAVDDPDCIFDQRHEVQANRFAARIIMPANLVRKLHKEGLSVSELAGKFKVSRRAMEIRLETLRLPVHR